MTREEFETILDKSCRIPVQKFEEMLALYRQVNNRRGPRMRILDIEFAAHDDDPGADVIADGRVQGYENPVEAWTAFIHKVDAAGRRRIGNRLEQHGRNQYSGLPTTNTTAKEDHT